MGGLSANSEAVGNDHQKGNFTKCTRCLSSEKTDSVFIVQRKTLEVLFNKKNLRSGWKGGVLQVQASQNNLGRPARGERVTCKDKQKKTASATPTK